MGYSYCLNMLISPSVITKPHHMSQILILYYHFHTKKLNHSYKVKPTFKIAQIISKWTKIVLSETQLNLFTVKTQHSILHANCRLSLTFRSYLMFRDFFLSSLHLRFMLSSRLCNRAASSEPSRDLRIFCPFSSRLWKMSVWVSISACSSYGSNRK